MSGRRQQTTIVDPGAVSAARVRADARRAYRHGEEGLEARQRARLGEIVSFARQRSDFYRLLYRSLPQGVADVTRLPPTNKTELMGRFDEVVTDPRVPLAGAAAFAADPSRIGVPFLSDYTVATTSGTTGTRGLFLLDRGTLRVAAAMSARMLGQWMTFGDVPHMLRRGGRIVMVSASGGHFASAAAAARLRSRPIGRRLVHLIPVHTPMPELVAALNALQPSVLASYSTTALLLAAEQEANRLRIRPRLVVLSAEGLSDLETQRIGEAFGAKVGSSYAATECPFLSFSCRYGWMHVNTDWAVLEPVRKDYSPCEPGEQSHTVLLTNLANRVQPILRYDLGDSVLARADGCDCGSPLPAIRVQGRSADVLEFPSNGERVVTITALTLSALLDGIPGIDVAQIVQRAPAVLDIRLRTTDGADPELAWQATADALIALFRGQGIEVELRRRPERPMPSAGGKYRLVEPLHWSR